MQSTQTTQLPTQQKGTQQKMSEERTNLRNYYEILEVNQNATLSEIQKAYQRLALRWHPDKHTADRKLAEKKFQQISQAFDVLSDPNKRSTYDSMFSKQSSLETAYKIFDQFFGENEMFDQEQEKFFQKNYPERRKNYYNILGVSRSATQDEIDRAYRKLALKYHPKNNPNNEQVARKFVEVNEAYQTLSNKNKRLTYNDLMFTEIVPRRAHDIFEDFFSDRWTDFPNQVDFFRPIFDRRSRMIPRFGEMWDMNRDVLRKMDSELDSIKQGQSYHRQERFEKKNGREHHTAQTTKRKLTNGVLEQETLKENILPTGERDVIRTIKRGDKVDTKTFHLKSGEQLPRQLTNY